MIVLDASAAVALLLNAPPRSGEVAELVADDEIHVPHLFDLEVVSAVRRYLREGTIGEDVAGGAIEDLSSLQMERHAHYPDIGRVWQLRENLTPYDAAYIALAESLECALITADAKIARAPGVVANVRLIK